MLKTLIRKVIQSLVTAARWVSPGVAWRLGYVSRVHHETEKWAAGVRACEEIRPQRPGFCKVHMSALRTDRSPEPLRCLPEDERTDLPYFFPPVVSRELFVAGIPGGSIFGRNGFVLDNDGGVMADVPQVLTTGFAGEHPLSFRRLASKVRRLEGQTATLAVFSVNNYYHWLYDAIPRLAIMRAAGFDLNAIDQFVVTRDAHGFVQATLAHFGIGSEKLVVASDDEILKCEYLIVPSMPALGDRSAPDWMVNSLREMLPTEAVDRGELKIFVARKPGTRRALENLAEIEAVVAKAGFQTVFPEDLDFEAQCALFSRVQSVIAIHGAALTNLVFCQPGVRVLEIFAPGYMNLCYAPLAARVGARYAYIFGEGDTDQALLQIGNVGKSIRLDANKLRKLLKEYFHD